MFPKSNSNKKPIKLGVNSNKMKDMNAFLENELKLLDKMKTKSRRNNPTTLNNPNLNLNNLNENKTNPISSNNTPFVVNNSMAESQNFLKNSMSNKGLNPNQKTIEDNMRTSQTKFEGFTNVTKFTESNTNTSQFIDKNESRRARRPPSTSSNKSEPFIIKFPQEQIQNKKAKEILKNLNKERDTDINFRNNNIIENISGLKPSNLKKEEPKKPYIESYNKIADAPKNIFGDEEIEEDYGDFENVDADKDKKNENKNENKNDWEDMFGENANFNDVDEDKVLKPQKINKDKSKRDQIIERLNDIKNIILLSEEYIEIASIEKTSDNKNGTMDFNMGSNQGKQDLAINTDPIVYKEKGTATEEAFDLNMNNNDINDNENEEENKDKGLLHISSYNQNVDEKKSKIILSSYQPLSYDAYNVFVNTAPAIEKMLLNNINKYILQKKDEKHIEENTGIHKLSMEFEFPNDLLVYMFPNNSNNININIDKFLFFDTKPYLVAFSLSLTTKDCSNLSPIFEDNFGNFESVNLVMLFDIFTKKVVKTLFSQSKINDMIAIGDGENILVAARVGGEYDIFDITLKGDDTQDEGDVKYFLGFEKDNNNTSLGRADINQKSTPINNNPKFKLILPIFSTYNFMLLNDIKNKEEENMPIKNIGFNSQVKKMIKAINKNEEYNNYIDKLYEVFIFDQTGYLISFQFNDSDTQSYSYLEHAFNEPYINFDLNPLIKRCFNTLPDNGNFAKENMLTEIYDIKYYKDNILYVLCNFGLCKLTIEGKDTFLCDPIYCSLSEGNNNSMTCFDISDLGQIVAGFNDNSVKIIDSENKQCLYSSYVEGVDDSTLINNISWSKAICKTTKNKLIRRTLLANFFIFTSKNEFVIYDLNQKKIENLRKIKKFKDFGKVLKLSRKNSLIEMSDCLFTDYSNFIAMSECNQINKAKFSITKLSLRKQYYDESQILKVNKKIISKLLNLLNN